MIHNDDELRETVAKVSADLQAIQNYLGQDNHSDSKVTFPRGYIRTATYFRSRFAFVSDETLKSNVAYALILSDVYRWLLNRTDLSHTAKEMIIKEGVCLVGSLCESVTKNVLNGLITKKAGYKARTEYLQQHEIIDAELKQDLDWVWDTRNNEHLFLIEIREHQHYKLADYNRAIRALISLRDKLDANYKKLIGI